MARGALIIAAITWLNAATPNINVAIGANLSDVVTQSAVAKEHIACSEEARQDLSACR